MTTTRPHLRLHVITLLAAAYVIAWSTLGQRSPREVARTAPPRATVWYGDLAPADRPRVVLPPGWSVASAPPGAEPAALTRAPREVRVAPAAARRIRTRSS